MAELIDDRVTGYLVTNPDEAREAVDCAADLDRDAIRAVAVSRFLITTMIHKYVAAYRTVLDPHETNCAADVGFESGTSRPIWVRSAGSDRAIDVRSGSNRRARRHQRRRRQCATGSIAGSPAP